MPPTDPTLLLRLRALLHEANGEPVATVRALAAERTALAGDDELARELLAIELQWLERQRDATGPANAAALAAARREWLTVRVEAAVAGALGDTATLFDLAEARAAARTFGETALAERCAVAIAAGVPQVRPGPELEEEAAERFAELSTAIEDLTLPLQVQLLRESSLLMASLAARAESKPCRRLARRLGRAADDRVLASRLERLIGRRGVAAVETTNFVLLLVVLGTLLVSATVDLSAGWQLALQWTEALACLFFVVDFVFELVLHPNRVSWFLRNAVTDLLPAIPSVLFLFPGSLDVPAVADGAVVLRLLRLLRVTWAARYVQALRPLLRSARLLLFLVRGLDGLAARFTQILNREFVFVPGAAEIRRPIVEDERRDLLYGALRREHELLALLSADDRAELVGERLQLVRATIAQLGPGREPKRLGAAIGRDVPIGQAIEFLWSLRPQDVARWLRGADIRALDRTIRVLSAAPVRWLPIIRRFTVHPAPPTAEERIVALGRRVAEWLDGWHGRLLFFADLHGIVTGPQILDRVASAMVKASQRPAVRLLLFGGLFLLFDLLVHNEWLSRVLGNIVATPLIVLGSFGLVVLTLGRWLKAIAGEASESYRLTSEANFLSQLERVKPRYEAVDLPFLTRRVFGDEAVVTEACDVLRAQVATVRTGKRAAPVAASPFVALEANRIGMLYLHYLDGAPLHISDVQTTEQLLANQSIENLRLDFLAIDKRERKRLRKLKLDDGSLLSGPYLWFRFITESVAVECAKRITGYNRACVPLAALAEAPPAQLQQMADWLARRSDPRSGRTFAKAEQPDVVSGYPTTEFTALDFVGGDPERDRQLTALFGEEVVAVLRHDRQKMIREIFGTRPVHHLPKHERSFNPLRFYAKWLSAGRVVLLPVFIAWWFCKRVAWSVRRVRRIVREVFDPELAMQRRMVGIAPFAVALRKIHRMRAPGLLEAMRLRLRLDPSYAGAPAGWSAGAAFAEESELERDLAFLHMHEREAFEMRESAEALRRHVAALHAALAWLPSLAPRAREGSGTRDDGLRIAGELAVTSAWIADRRHVRTLLLAERWRAETLPQLLAEGAPGTLWRDAWEALRAMLSSHPVDRWLERHARDLPAKALRPLRRAFAHDHLKVRTMLTAWLELPDTASPTATAIERLREDYRTGPAIQRDLMVLRTIQSLAVLDVRNYRDLVFRLGGYAEDGEDPRLGSALPGVPA